MPTSDQTSTGGQRDPRGQRPIGAFELAAVTLVRRYGTLDPEAIEAAGGDPAEVGAAFNIVERLSTAPPDDVAAGVGPARTRPAR